MRRTIWPMMACTVVALAGCQTRRSELTPTHQKALNHYEERAAQIAYRQADEPAAIELSAPRSIDNPDNVPNWHLSLVEAVRLALQNNRLIRTNNEFLLPGNRLLTNPDATPSVFDLAIQESGVQVGNRGLSAALSDFDPRVTSSMTWGRDETIQNNLFLSGGIPPGGTLVEESAAFNSRIEKVFATGGQIALTDNWNYSSNNSAARLFGSAYTGSLGLEYRHPLWAGSGTKFTQIAGPVGQINERVTGVSQGIAISRINADISLSEFEGNVSQLMLDVTQLYWDLYRTYQEYEIERSVRDATKKTWDLVAAKKKTGFIGGGAADEAQANEEYLASRARTELALATLWETEGRLRRIMGLPTNDGQLIRPADLPETNEHGNDWSIAVAEAFSRRTQLRRQKSNLRSLQLQLQAASSLTKPRLDFVAGYRVNAFGDDLIASSDNDGVTAQGLRSAAGTLTQGDQTGWDLGFSFSVPLGVRAERAQVRNLELRLAKARAALAAQEREIQHELANAFNQLERWHKNAKTNLERQQVSEVRVNALAALFKTGGTVPLDILLRARLSQAQAEIEYAGSVAEYNKSIANLAFRKGTLFEHYYVRCAEREQEPTELASDGPTSPINAAVQPDDFEPDGTGWSEPVGS